MEAKKPTFIDLFAGCGGLSLGIEKAGFFPLYVNELNRDALNSYLMNREKEFPHLLEKHFHSQDIKDCINNSFFKTLKKDIKDRFGVSNVDLICGGPPCQGYSGIGHRRSYAVNKKQLPSNHLYEDMAHFIFKMQPKIFLFENVRGLLSARWTAKGKKGEIFEDIKNTFKALDNYSIKHTLVYAKDYGVPQNRPRILLVGIREDIFKPISEDYDAIKNGFLPVGEGGYPHIVEIFSDIEDKKFKYGEQTRTYPHNPKNHFQKQLRTRPDGTVALKGDEITEHQYSNHTQRTRDKFQAMIEDDDGQIPKEFKTKKFAQRRLKRRWGNKGPTITAASLPDDFVHYSQPRSLTVREWARLQTFPDWYQFAGKRTTGGIRRAGNPRKKIYEREAPKYTQIGNAVAVNLAEAIGLNFKSILNGK